MSQQLRDALRKLTLAVEQDRNCDFNSEHPAVEAAMKGAYEALAACALSSQAEQAEQVVRLEDIETGKAWDALRKKAKRPAWAGDPSTQDYASTQPTPQEKA